MVMQIQKTKKCVKISIFVCFEMNMPLSSDNNNQIVKFSIN